MLFHHIQIFWDVPVEVIHRVNMNEYKHVI